MHLFTVMLLVAACAWAVCAGVYWGVVLFRVARSHRLLPTLRNGLDAPAPTNEAGEEVWPAVTVIVPAHNEEGSIAASARTLMAQDYPGAFRVVYVLDRCADQTAEILRDITSQDDRFEVIHNENCPKGWAGKTHAAWRGVNDSAGAPAADLLLFSDADVWYEPGAVRASVAMLIKRNVDMLSLLCTLRSKVSHELVAQSAAGVELIRQFPLDKANSRGRNKRFANGQFMLFRKATYHRIGGHERVKETLLEDLAFARLAQGDQPEMNVGVLMADGVVHCDMYDTWPQFIRGWKRIYAEAEYCRPTPLRKHARRVLITGTLLPHGPSVCLALSVLAARANDAPLFVLMHLIAWPCLALVLWSLVRIYRSQHAPLWAIPLYPIGAAVVAKILTEAASDLEQGVKTEWGGIAYERKPQRLERAEVNAIRAAGGETDGTVPGQQSTAEQQAEHDQPSNNH